MCGDPDYCYTSLTSRTHKARKPHECCACDEPIRKGDRYVRTFATTDLRQDNRMESYKHCFRCYTILTAVRNARPNAAIRWDLNCGELWEDEIGTLPAEVARLAFLTPDECQQQLKPATEEASYTTT